MSGARDAHDANVRYHDRIAPRYDDVYRADPYWEHYFDVSWALMKGFLPRDLATPVLDVGCGTGLYGLRLLKSGFRVTFSDLSQKMLDRAAAKAEDAFAGRAAAFVRADLQDLAPFADASFGFVVAQGDPLSFVPDPGRAVRAISRVLSPGGVAVVSVDSRFGGVEPFVKRADLEGLAAFLRSGDSAWLADMREERFPTHAFTPTELRRLAERAGLDVLAVAGKTLFDLRGGSPWLEDRDARRRLLALELDYASAELGLARGRHLQAVWRKRQ